jgi:hypothetical protein
MAAVLALAALALPAGGAGAGEREREAPPAANGFALSPHAVPLDEIVPGGPPRDGIPALNHPRAVDASEATWPDEEVVVGVSAGGAVRAYPIAILDWHELVNDSLGGEPVLVSYCPLCGTALVFSRRVEGLTLTFGVSGLLYRSDLLLYDRESESLWSQISAKAVAGARTGARLRVLRSELARWSQWRARHPDTTVLTTDTGHRRPYGRSPYAGYERSRDVYFPAPVDPRYHPKMPTLGVRVPDGPARAYPAVEVVQAGGLVEDSFEGRTLAVRYDPEDQVFRVEAPPDLEVVEGYWFAWAAFHPSTSVFVAGDGFPRSRPEAETGP